MIFTPVMRGIHTKKLVGGVNGGGELGYTAGLPRGVWGVRGQGMMYYGSGVAVV